MGKARPRRPRGAGPWRLFGIAAAMAAAALVSSARGTTADPGPAGASVASTPSMPPVAIEGGRLAVDLRQAELEPVLREIAALAAFHLKTSGPLGRVTAIFSGVSVEEGLRRLAPDHELMLVYRSSAGQAEPTLVEVRVFAGPRADDPRLQAADLAEIDRLGRAPGGQQATARLVELLGTASQAMVRARAAAALGRFGGLDAEAALVGALSDQVAAVRMQAVDALRRVAGVRAIPALQALLLRDPDPAVRRSVARTLGLLRDARAASALSAAAADPDATVRQTVARALWRHGIAAP